MLLLLRHLVTLELKVKRKEEAGVLEACGIDKESGRQLREFFQNHDPEGVGAIPVMQVHHMLKVLGVAQGQKERRALIAALRETVGEKPGAVVTFINFVQVMHRIEEMTKTGGAS